jgi:ATP-dependent Clp protease ATP-binding subunit ClpA
MATLHVRNVPEPLYHLLREAAERDGRSIGAQAVHLLQRVLSPEAALASRRSFGARQFAESARELVVQAQREARAAGAPEVEPVHLLLALLEANRPAREALERLGVDADAVRESLPPGPGAPGRLPFSAGSRFVLERALRESLALRHSAIGGEHVLLALADDPVLAGLDPELVRTEALLAFARPHATVELRPAGGEYLAVDLDGDADAWTARLNELATQGWELLQLIDRRAILRRA